MNQITHWLDASNVYGSDARDTRQLRQGRLGRLKTSIEPGKGRHPQDLPKCAGYDQEKPAMCSGCPACFVAGSYFNSCIGNHERMYVYITQQLYLEPTLSI